MANPDILITPGQGTIGFSGTNTGTIQLRVAESGDIHFEGDQGSLLSISDDLSDSLFSVNDAAGMPVFEVFADDTIKAYRNNESKLEIDPNNNRIRLRDNAYVSGDLYVSGAIVTNDGTSPDHISGLSGYFGKVGIGSSSIDALTDGTATRLQISHPDESFAVNLKAAGTSYIPSLALSSDRPSASQEMGKIKWLNNGASPVAQIKAIRGSSDTVGHLNFQTCNAHAMQIWSDQKVQIASTQHVAPQATLVVSGDASVSGELVAAGPIVAKTVGRVQADVLNNSANSANIIYRSSTTTIVGNHTNGLIIHDDGSGQMRNLDIKCTSSWRAANIAEVNNANLAFRISQTRQGQTSALAMGSIGSNNADIGIQAYDTSDSSNEPLAINPFGGHVGVGTASPDTQLTVLAQGTTDVVANFKSPDTNAWIQLRDDTTTDTAVMVGATADDMRLRAGSNEHVRIKAGGNVGIGTTAPGTLLELYSSGPIFRIKDGGQYGANATPYIQFNDNNGTISKIGKLNDSNTVGFDIETVSGDIRLRATSSADPELRVTSSGVGIGTADPNNTLHVHTASAGSVTADTDRDDLVIENSTNVGLTFLSPNTDKAAIAFGDPQNSRVGLITYDHAHDSLAIRTNNTDNLLTVQNGGEVGIGGTGQYGSKLTVHGDAGVTGELRVGDNLATSGIAGIGINPTSHRLEVYGGSYNSNLKLRGGGAAVGIQFVDNDENTDGYIYAAGTNIGFLDAGTDWMVRCVNDQYIYFATNGNTEHMRITSDGNVGIGTSAPLTGLTVASTMSTSPTSQIYLDVYGGNTDGGGGELIFNTSASAGDLSNYNAIIRGTRSSAGNGSSDLTFLTTNVSVANSPAARMTIKDNGNVGIGTISPASALHVKSSDAAVQATLTSVGTNAPSRINFASQGVGRAGIQVAGTERMQITHDGKVGIGLAASSSVTTGKLHVYQSGDSQPALLVEGSQGSLFSVEDTLTGSLMSVNDIAGLPVFEAFDDGTIVMGQYNSGDLVVTGNNIGIGTAAPVNQLHVHGHADGFGYIRITDGGLGATATDGCRIGYNSSALRIQNYENSNISFFTNDTTEVLTMSTNEATFGGDAIFQGDEFAFGTGTLNSNYSFVSVNKDYGIFSINTSTSDRPSFVAHHPRLAGTRAQVLTYFDQNGGTLRGGATTWSIYADNINDSAATADFAINTRGNSFSDAFIVTNAGDAKVESDLTVSGTAGVGVAPQGGSVLAVDGDVGVSGAIRSNNNIFANNYFVNDFIYHNGDTNSYLGFVQNDHIVFRTAGTDRVLIDDVGNTSITGQLRTNGAVGIGTSVPGTLLHIYADSSSSQEIFFDNNGVGSVGATFRTDFATDAGLANFIRFDAADDGGNNTRYSTIESFIVDNTDTEEDGRLTFSTMVAGTDTETMHIVGGNVGINTASPGSLLKVYEDDSSAGNTQIHVHNDKTDDAAVIKLEGKRSSLNDCGQVLFANNGNNSAAIKAFSNSSTQEGILTFSISAPGSADTVTEAMRINNTGNIGIGTTSPDVKLHLYGGGSPQFRIEDSTNNCILKAYAQDSDAFLGTHSNHNLNIGTNNATNITVKAGGNVGIGTSPAHILEVYSAAPVINIKDGGAYTANATPYLQFSDYNNYISRIGKLDNSNSVGLDLQTNSGDIHLNPAGNVGIGTSNPQAMLQVSGDASISGDLSVTRFIKHGGDEDTKIDFGSTEIDFFANNVKGISVKTTEVAINDNSADVDFRVETDGNANMLFVEGSTNRVGINRTSMDATFDVGGDAIVRGNLYFDGVSSSYIDNSSHELQLRGAAGVSLFTHVSAGWTERLTVTDPGNVGIGTILPSGILHAENNSTGIIVANDQITGNAFEVFGAQGNLLTITDDLSDSLFSVNDAAGMPVFEVFANDTIKSYRNNESKFEVDPDNNRIRLRDNVNISGLTTITGGAVVGGGTRFTAGGTHELSINLGVGDCIGIGASDSALNYFRRYSATNETLQLQTYAGANNGIFSMQPYGGEVHIGMNNGTAILGSLLAVDGDAQISGQLRVGADGEGGIRIGSWQNGSNQSYGAIMHEEVAAGDADHYGLLLGPASAQDTYLNAAAGREVYIRVDNSAEYDCEFSSTGVLFNRGHLPNADFAVRGDTDGTCVFAVDAGGEFTNLQSAKLKIAGSASVGYLKCTNSNGTVTFDTLGWDDLPAISTLSELT